MNADQKRRRIERALRHQEQDRLISGTYMKISPELSLPKGCSVGCDAIDIQLEDGIDIENLVDSNCHSLVAKHDGTPEWLEQLRDAVFEGLPPEDRSWWHVELAKSLPETEEWESYYHKFCIVFLKDSLSNKSCWQDPYGVVVESAIENCIHYHENPVESGARSARSAASAAWAAWAARSAAAESAAESAAAESAAWAAESAAWAAASAAWAAAWSAESAISAESARSAESPAWSAAWKRIATELLNTLSE